jgi:putative protease
LTEKKPELLAPAGTLEKLKMALAFGADAVYLGGKAYGLRALGGNFTQDELREAVAYAHARAAKVYVTVNIFPHNADLNGLPDYLRFLQEIQVDGLLVADLGVFMMAKEVAPQLPLHISTQANNTNWRTVCEWQKLGAQRVVLARELSLQEIREIRQHTDVELEMFVHGAMCISYSGRCLLSSYFTGRDANRGSCAQCCRWKYALVEETRPGQYFPIAEDERGTYIMNSKDLCLLPYLPEVMACGVDSLKIEGRMKSVHYAASVTKAYRAAIDSYVKDPQNFAVRQEWREELAKVSHRPYTTGFAFGRPTAEDQVYGTSSYEQNSDFVGLVRDYDAATGYALVEQRNNMKCGQELEIFPPQGEGWRQELRDMLDEDGEPITVAPHPQQLVHIRMARPVEPWTILRRDIGNDMEKG